LLVRSQRADALRERGLQVVSPHGDFTVYPKAITATQLASTFDVIFLSVKGFALPSAMKDFAPAVGPQTLIVPVLNVWMANCYFAIRRACNIVLSPG
jgi:2-dehydropantoate 2-reductase